MPRALPCSIQNKRIAVGGWAAEAEKENKCVHPFDRKAGTLILSFVRWVGGHKKQRKRISVQRLGLSYQQGEKVPRRTLCKLKFNHAKRELLMVPHHRLNGSGNMCTPWEKLLLNPRWAGWRSRSS
eukprot:111668-Amphidinium_carterae.1